MSLSRSFQGHALNTSDRVIINILILGAILPLLDTTLINISLHGIEKDLGSSLSMLQWVLAIYTLTAAITVPLCPWLASWLGARRLWIASLCLFLIGATLSALAQSLEFLIFARILQGTATGLLLPTMQTIVMMKVGKSKMGAALTALSMPAVIAPILGPVIAGLILEFLHWRWVFWAHVPICLLAIAFALKHIPTGSKGSARDFDFVGFVLLCLGISTLVYGSGRLGSGVDGWQLPGLIGLTSLAVFFSYARRKREKTIVNVGLLKTASVRASCTLLLLSSIAHYGGLLLFPLYLIKIGGYGVASAGVLVSLHGVGTLIARQQLHRAPEHWGNQRCAQLAVVGALAGSAILCVPQFMAYPLLMGSGMLLRGAGVGVLTILAMAGAYTEIQPAQIWHASALTRITTHLGATLGAVIIAALVVSQRSSTAVGNGFLLSAHLGLMIAVLASWQACRRLKG